MKLKIVCNENENLSFITLPPVQGWISQIQHILRILSSQTRLNASSTVVHRCFLFLLSDGVDGSASGAVLYIKVASSLLFLIITMGLHASPGGGGGLYPVDRTTWGIQMTGWDGDSVGQYPGCIICLAGVGFLMTRGGGALASSNWDPSLSSLLFTPLSLSITPDIWTSN